MAAGSGKWVPIDEYARGLGIDEAQARARTESSQATLKEAQGVRYVWVDDDPAAPSEPEQPGASATAPASASGPAPSEEDVVMEQSSISRLPLSQEMALQTERALSLVERSLNAFMLMHQEVIQEKDRSMERSRDGIQEKDQEIRERDGKVRELERALAEKDQEIADLKMLVGILENRSPRAPVREPEPLDAPERATVGDLMEEQLRYIMEEDMIQDLLKE